jgi:transcriptional regulator with XRE-family HTH domain
MGAIKRITAKKRATRKHFHQEMGQYFRTKREEAGLTLSQVGDFANCTGQFICNIERGGAFPSPHLLNSMLKAYHIDQDEFLDFFMKVKLSYYRGLHYPSISQKLSVLMLVFCAQVNNLGFSLNAHHENSFSKFESLAIEKQEQIYKNFSVYYDICATALENDIDLYDDKFSLIWWACQRLKLRPTSEFFSLLEKGDIVELYGLDFVQIFRTFDMFKYLSYSLDQIFSYEFWELFKRDPSITEETISIAKKYISGEIRSIHWPEFQDHVVEEIFSLRKNKAKIRHKFFAPFFDNKGNLKAIGSVFKILEFGDISH